jgi:hypothetical protein
LTVPKRRDLDAEHRDEAERLKLLPEETRQQFMAAFRAAVEDPALGPRDRKKALERVEALERLLRVLP